MDKVKNFFQKIKNSICSFGSKVKKLFSDLLTKIKGLDKKKKIILLVVTIIVLALIILGIVLLVISGQKKKSMEYAMGNLNNKGMVDSAGGTVYLDYYNTDIENGENVDKNGIYKLSGKKLKLIDKQAEVRSINVVGKWIYYVSIDTSDYHKEIVKINKNGKDRTVLVDDIEGINPSGGEMFVKGKDIYFIGKNDKLETIRTDGKKRKQISNEELISFQIVDKNIYFLTVDYELKKMSINGENVEEITSVNMDSFQIEKDNIYYIDKADEYLKKMDLNGENISNVIENEVQYYNITDGNLYYQKVSEDNESSSIYKVNLKNNKETKVVDLNGAAYTNICVAGNWIYYVDKIEGNYYYYTIYRVKANGDKKEMLTVD